MAERIPWIVENYELIAAFLGAVEFMYHENCSRKVAIPNVIS